MYSAPITISHLPCLTEYVTMETLLALQGVDCHVTHTFPPRVNNDRIQFTLLGGYSTFILHALSLYALYEVDICNTYNAADHDVWQAVQECLVTGRSLQFWVISNKSLRQSCLEKSEQTSCQSLRFKFCAE